MAKPKKYYAVRVGHKPGIYTYLKETEQQINGFRGAEFSSFRLKKDAQMYLQKNTMTEAAKEDDKSIGQDSETVRKEIYQNENQEGAPVNSVPNDFYITLDEYSDENESEANGIKQEIRNIWEYCDLIWDLHKEKNQRIDQIQLSLRDKTREQINKEDSDMPNIDGYYSSTPDISFHSSLGHKTQNVEDDTCYTPTAQLQHWSNYLQP